MIQEKVEFNDCCNGVVYYYNDNNPYKIVFKKDGDIPLGLFQEDDYIMIFGLEVVCKNGLDLDTIDKGNCDDYLFKIIDCCDGCSGSRTPDFPNEYGLCNCWCDCGDLYRDCDCGRE